MKHIQHNLTQGSPISTFFLCISLVTSLLISSETRAMDAEVNDSDQTQSALLDSIPVCYNFGCKVEDSVSLSQEEWKTIAGWFTPAATSAEEERAQMQKAIGWMEVVIGRHTPTHRDIAFDLSHDEDKPSEFPGQLDCIDESINTTTYLDLFEKLDLLKYHTVIDRAYRKAIFDQHWAAQVQEVDTHDKYVIDSWFQDNGFLPSVQSSEKWGKITFLSAVVDNSNGSGNEEVKRSLWHRFLRRE